MVQKCSKPKFGARSSNSITIPLSVTPKTGPKSSKRPSKNHFMSGRINMPTPSEPLPHPVSAISNKEWAAHSGKSPASVFDNYNRKDQPPGLPQSRRHSESNPTGEDARCESTAGGAHEPNSLN